MLKEAISFLNPKKGDFFVDCTLGGSGYTLELSRSVSDDGIVISFDLDDLAIKNAEEIIKNQKIKNIILIKENFRHLDKKINELEKYQNQKFNGIVLDLGLSSAQLSDGNRGISFKMDGPLNMAFGENQEVTTSEIINNWDQSEICKILRNYGEEKFANSIAHGIVSTREKKKISTTGELVEIIRSSVPKKYLYSKIHFATRTFQALRIATNDELGALEEVLPQVISRLKSGGRCVVISYHSLEDRIVKNFFKEESKTCNCDKNQLVCNCENIQKIKLINKKVILPSDEEIKKNPRARSAKMRVIEKI